MTALRLKFVQAFQVDGKRFFYFRKRGSPRVRLPGLPGSAEFMAVYADALAAAPSPIGAAKRSRPGSVSAAIADYYGSQAFRNLTNTTAVNRRSSLERFRERFGDRTLASLPKEFLVTLLDSMPAHAARNLLKAFRHFSKWAESRKLVRNDPTLGIRLKMPKSEGFRTWTEDEIGAFEAHHPVGSKARLAMALGLYTGQRRGDVLRIGRQHIRNGALSVRQEKTGTALVIPVHPELARILAATPIGHLTFLTTRNGGAFRSDGFSEQFRRWCTAAGLPDHCVFHGLRKAAARRLAEAGCTAHEIASITGHASLSEVQRYTKAVDQARLARAAMAKTSTQQERPMARTSTQEQTVAKSVKANPAAVSNPLKALTEK
jgi:integrase